MRRSSIDNISMMTDNMSLRGAEESFRDFTQVSVGSGPLVIDKDTIVALRDAYRVAQTKAEECDLPEKMQLQKIGSLSTLMHLRLAHRVYTAISTLLYATIGMSKVASLEKFIRRKASTLPAAIYNGDDWAKILQIAKQYRLQNVYDVKLASGSHEGVEVADSVVTVPDNREGLGALARELAQVKHAKRELTRALEELRHRHKTDLAEASQSLARAAVEREATFAKRYEELQNEAKEAKKLADLSVKPAKKQQQQENFGSEAGGAHGAAEMGAAMKEVEELRKQLSREEQNAAMLLQQVQEASVANAQYAADKTALRSKCADLEATVSQLETQKLEMKERMEGRNSQQTSSKLEADVKAATAEGARLRKSLEEAEAAGAQLREETSKRLKESEEEKSALKRSLESKRQELIVAVASVDALKLAASEAAAAAEREAQQSASASGGATIGSLQAALKQATLKNSSLEAELKTIMAEKESYRTQIANLKEDLASAGKATSEATEREQLLKQQLAEATSSVATLTSAVEEAVTIERVRSKEKDEEVAKKEQELSVALAAVTRAKEGEDVSLCEVQKVREEMLQMQTKHKEELEKASNAAAEITTNVQLQNSQANLAVMKLSEETSSLAKAKAEWQLEREGLEKDLSSMKRQLSNLQENVNVTPSIQESASAPVLDTTEAAGLRKRVEELEGALAKAEVAAKEADTWRQKADAFQKQTVDMRQRVAAASSIAAPASNVSRVSRGGFHERIYSPQERLVGSVRIVAPSQKHQHSHGSSKKRKTSSKKEAATSIQAAIRGSMIREKLYHAALTHTAKEQGLMVALAGTTQGQTGWYLKYEGGEAKYFYFCLDKGEFVMLTGPISEGDYRKCMIHDSGRSKYDTISVDRSAVESTRTQVIYLANQVATRQNIIEELHHQMANMKADHTKLLKKATDKAELAAKVAREEVDAQRNKRRHLEEKLHDVVKEKNRVEELARSKVRTEKEKQQFVEDVSKFLGARAHSNMVKLQAICRSFLTRRRLLRERNILAAARKGVMQALGNTKQGKSGWYMNPDGSVYYYQNAKGVWNRLAGPLTNKQYTLASEVNGKLGRNAEENSVLTRVHFDLMDSISMTHGPHAQVYMGNKSKELFVVFQAADFVDGNPTHSTRQRTNSIMRVRTRTSSFSKLVAFN